VRKLTCGSRDAAFPRNPNVDLRASRRIERSRFGGLLRRIMPRRSTDAIAAVCALAAVAVVLVNALALQRPPHPASRIVETPGAATAPSQAGTILKRTVAAAPAPISAPVPPQRPASASVHGRAELVLEIQRELANRGYYDGAVDGVLGPRTDQSIRDFEQAQGQRITGETSDALLGQIRRARAKTDITGSIPPAVESQRSSRVLTVQRILARLGYGPVRLNGTHDTTTRASIERFERDRNLPLSGEITDRLIRELAAVSGAPLE
jgi:peptidoglycan hydrolase-like protein with peptidoglycan-binding domain